MSGRSLVSVVAQAVSRSARLHQLQVLCTAFFDGHQASFNHWNLH